jgi:hypothetical protein
LEKTLRRDRKLLHGPLPSCPICGMKLEYVSVIRFDAPFQCPQCKTELRIAKSDSAIGAGISIALSICASLMLGLRGWNFLFGILVLVVPAAMLTSFARRHTSAPKLELSSCTLKLTD